MGKQVRALDDNTCRIAVRGNTVSSSQMVAVMLVRITASALIHWRQIMWPNKFRGTEVVLKDFPARTHAMLRRTTHNEAEVEGSRP